MIYIRKQRTPDTVRKRAKELTDASENDFNSITLPKDTKRLRDLFDQMPKSEIMSALYKEQHGLCAYCMRQIDPSKRGSARIEHYEALSKNKEKALDYQNYLAVCNGGERTDEDDRELEESEQKEKKKIRVLCCDAARGEKELTINPWDKRQMEAIGYKKNGEIIVLDNKGLDQELVKKMQNDIDHVLVLNGIKNDDGQVIYDTDTKLVAKRKNIYESVCQEFERWDKQKRLTRDFLKDIIEKCENMMNRDGIAEEYIGERLYFYRKKYRKMER